MYRDTMSALNRHSSQISVLQIVYIFIINININHKILKNAYIVNINKSGSKMIN
jgi:hypothetical protein